VQEDAEIKSLVKHVLSKELQSYYDAVIGDVLSGDGERIKAALYSVATDSGLQQILPYFVQFVAEAVPKNLRSLGQLQIFIGLVSSLLANEHMFIEPYLHQIMPSLLSCLLGKRLCEDPQREDHWALRDRCAVITADLCKRFGHVYATLIPRVTKTMVRTLQDAEKPLTSHYGAIVGLTALGPRTVEVVLLPHMEAYCKVLSFNVVSEMQDSHALETLTAVEEGEKMMEEGDGGSGGGGGGGGGGGNTPAEISKCRSALKIAVTRWLADTANAVDEQRVGVRRQQMQKLFSL
jgi:transcription initiation factor TFIID subunit 6